MRSDIHVGDYVTLPPSQIQTTTAALSAFSGLRAGSIFKGRFWVGKVRHVGDFKAAQAQAWVTQLECVAASPDAGSSAPPVGNVEIGPITMTPIT